MDPLSLSLSPSESSTARLHDAAGAPGAGRWGRVHLLLERVKVLQIIRDSVPRGTPKWHVRRQAYRPV